MSAADQFGQFGQGLSSPCEHLVKTSGDDANDLAAVCKAILVGTAGNIKVTTKGGETDTFYFTAGWHPIRLSRIWATGMTAADVAYGW